MTDPELITDWRVDADVDDEPVLVGRRAGAPWRSLPVARIDLDARTARVVDGTVHRLGPSAVPADPLARCTRYRRQHASGASGVCAQRSIGCRKVEALPRRSWRPHRDSTAGRSGC